MIKSTKWPRNDLEENVFDSLRTPEKDNTMEETNDQDDHSSPGLDRRISSSTTLEELTLNRRGGIICERWVNISLIPPAINITHPATTKTIVLASDPVAS
jgi:hypothetical protein